MAQDLLRYVPLNVVLRCSVDHACLPDGLEALHTAGPEAHQHRGLVDALMMKDVWVICV